MTNTWSRLLALPTAIALTLGGLAVAGAPANAEPAPMTTSTPGPAPSEPAPDADGPSGASDEEGAQEAAVPSEPGAEVAGEQVPTQPAPGEQAPVEGPAVDLEVDDEIADADAEAEADAGADAEPDAVAAEPLVLTSPVAGEVRRDLELRIEGESAGAESVEYVTSDPRVHGGQVGGVPRFAFRTDLPWDVASTLVVTVRSLDAAGRELGRAERTVTIDVPTSPPVVITSPATGSVLAADVIDWGPGNAPTTPDWGWFRVTGTGVPGQYLRLGLEALDLPSDHGTDGASVQVGADGGWTLDIARPFGTWRVSVAQFGLADVREEGGYLQGRATTRLSPATSIDVRLVPTQAEPPAVAPVAVPVAPGSLPTTLVPTARPVSSRPALASTGSADATGDALLVGLLLAGLGAATLALGRRRASGRRAQEAVPR